MPRSAVMGLSYFYQSKRSFAIDASVDLRSMDMPHDALPMQLPAVRLPNFMSADDLARIADAHDSGPGPYRRRTLADPKDIVRSRLEALGREIRMVALPPYLELVLYEFAAAPGAPQRDATMPPPAS